MAGTNLSMPSGSYSGPTIEWDKNDYRKNGGGNNIQTLSADRQGTRIDKTPSHMMGVSSEFSVGNISRGKVNSFDAPATNPTQPSQQPTQDAITGLMTGLSNRYSVGGGSAPVITWDKDGYISNRNNALRELADQVYNTGANNALNTQLSSITDAKQLYNDTASGVQNSQQEARQNYLNSITNANQNAYNALSQTNEASAFRGLSNSGLGTALSQSQYTQLNANLAQIDTEYNSEVQKLNRELSDAVKRFGLSKAEADQIYNNTMQTLSENRDSEYRRALDTATTESMQYQLEVDKTNAANATAIAQARINAQGSVNAALASAEAQLRGTMSANQYAMLSAYLQEANLGQNDMLIAIESILNGDSPQSTVNLIKGKVNSGQPSEQINRVF